MPRALMALVAGDCYTALSCRWRGRAWWRFFLVAMLSTWNNFLIPLIFTRSDDSQPLTDRADAIHRAVRGGVGGHVRRGRRDDAAALS